MDDVKMGLCSVQNLLLAFPGLIIVGINFFVENVSSNESFWDNGVNYVFMFNALFLIVCTYLSFRYDILYKHQVFVGVLLVCITLVCTFSWLHFAFTLYWTSGTEDYVSSPWYIGIVASVYVISFLINGFIEWRDYQRFIAKEKTDTRRKLPKPVFNAIWITLLILEFIGMKFKMFNGWYLGILGAAIFPKTTIVTAHAAYLKWKDKSYWEERAFIPSKENKTKVKK